MKEISEEDYMKTLRKVLEIRAKQTKEKNPIKRKYKLLQYAYSRGFEQELILDILKEED
jgi:regulatory protein